MESKEPVILPEKYYLDYFTYLLDFVERQYEHVLDKPEYLFYQSFRQLSEDAKCLYLRFSNRRGNFFRLKKISYPEIANITAAKDELVLKEFIRINENDDPIQFRLFTKSELIHLFDFLKSTQKKENILMELSEGDVPLLHQQEEIIEVLKNDEVDFIKLLFFGNRYGQMTDFVIRDVGNVKLERLDETKFKPWFQSREDALGVMHLSQLRKMIKEIKAADLPLEEYIEDMPWRQWLSFPRSKRSASHLLLDVAQHFERKNQPEVALSYFKLTDKPPSKERMVRLLNKLDREEEAIAVAKQMQEKPLNATELTFATDYLNKRGIRINRSMTERLKNAPSIDLPQPSKRVEDAVLDHFASQGWQGAHTENYIWKGLFGLIFWREIFDGGHGAFHHPLQRQPSDLNDSLFFENRSNALNERLSSLKSKKALIKELNLVYEEKQGMANRFVSWHESLQPTAIMMIEKVPLGGLKKVMLEMAKKMKENSTGFPDLFIWNDTSYHFYEVKSPNDQLSAQQLFWLDFLPAAGIKSEVLRVNYID